MLKENGKGDHDSKKQEHHQKNKNINQRILNAHYQDVNKLLDDFTQEITLENFYHPNRNSQRPVIISYFL